MPKREFLSVLFLREHHHTIWEALASCLCVRRCACGKNTDRIRYCEDTHQNENDQGHTKTAHLTLYTVHDAPDTPRPGCKKIANSGEARVYFTLRGRSARRRRSLTPELSCQTGCNKAAQRDRWGRGGLVKAGRDHAAPHRCCSGTEGGVGLPRRLAWLGIGLGLGLGLGLGSP